MTNQTEETGEAPPWGAATWEGATREAMRRWAKLPLERIIAAQEEMWELAEALNGPAGRGTSSTHRGR
ncbi:MAG TPA: hypothetical protein VFG91_05670 [Woeseiaceae bacterium]|nr:hypothetical protein [Woeseiaceae bacterium]